MLHNKQPWLLAACCLLAAVPAQAQTDHEGVLLRQQEQLQHLRQLHEVMSDVRVQTPKDSTLQNLPLDETPCVTIRRISIDTVGLPFNDKALLGAQGDDPPLGRCLGAKGVAILVARAQDALVAEGYATTRVAAQSQDLADGVLVLSVLPGRVARVRLASADSDEPWRGPPLLLQPGAVLNLRDIEQSLENLRRNPGAVAQVELAPAATEGHTEVLVDYRLARPLRGQLTLDDAGSRDTGQWQANATLSWDSPLGLADLLYLNLGGDVGGRQAGPRGSGNWVLHHSVPWNHWLFGWTASAQRYHQTLFGPWQSYRYDGESSQRELQAGRVVQRGMASKTRVLVKAFSRRSRNFINDTEVFVQRRATGGWEAAVEHTQHHGLSTFQATVNHRYGTGAFGSQPAIEERFGEGTSRMRLTQAALSMAAPFRWNGQSFQYFGQLRVQWNQSALTPPDRFCIGGRYTVRGFDGAQALCAERGQSLRQEWVWAPSESALQPYVALDLGRVSGQSAPARAVLAGWGVGLRGAVDRAGRTASVDLFMGRPIHHPQGFETAGTAVALSLSLGF